ncbi:MAG: hypothetical protein LBC98_04185 [Prevotellaceae bacterium]|nr:hypothetical protein [Prevotellaceae bacterium]
MKNIIKHLLKPALAFCLIAGLNACVRDKGNYDYKQINTVRIGDAGNDDGLNNYTKNIGDTLRVNPVLTFSQGEDENLFRFTWHYWGGGIWNVLHEGRNLEIEVSGTFGKATVTEPYRLAYEVVNKETQVSYRKTFTLTVISPLLRGYTALCELENGFDIDLISLSSSDYKFYYYKNILEMTASDIPREGAKPYDIVAFEDKMAPDPFNKTGTEYSVFVLTDKYATRVLAEDYSWKPSYEISNVIEMNSHLDREYTQKGDKVIAQQMKFSYVYSASSGRRVRCFMYHTEPDGKGNWYLWNTFPAWHTFSVQMNNVRPSGNARYEPAPHIYAGASGAMYYNKDGKAFMYGSFPGSSDYGTAAMYYTQPLVDPTFSDPAYVDLIYMGEILGAHSPSRGYAILKLNSGALRYIEFNDASAVGSVAISRTALIPQGTGIESAKFIARVPDQNAPFLIYVTNDNRVFQLDISAGTIAGRDITNVILKNDGYSEITLFKYTLPNTHGIPAGAGLDKALAVGTYNPALGKDAGGKLEFFKMTNTTFGDLELVKYPETPRESDGYQIDMSFTGLGKITGLTYKEK